MKLKPIWQGGVCNLPRESGQGVGQIVNLAYIFDSNFQKMNQTLHVLFQVW